MTQGQQEISPKQTESLFSYWKINIFKKRIFLFLDILGLTLTAVTF